MSKPKLNLKFRDVTLLGLLVLLMALPGLRALPVIDRDEARYAQASVQMIETGDYVNIRFQDRARNKKPAGAYWAQTTSINLLSDAKARQIWAHRVPSVLAALLAVLFTYWGGIRMLGRETAFIGAVFLAISMLFIFEAHIAKTDALLCGCSALALAALGRIRSGGGKGYGTAFWIAVGCAVIIKGPLLPLLVVLTLLTLFIWERDIKWAKPLLFPLGPLLAILIVAPWTYLIWQETGGAFFKDAIGGDLAPKLASGQEKHGGWPGYYALGIWVFFWPASLFLLAGLAFGFRAARNATLKDTPIARSSRLLLAWIIPFWIVLEIVPTKLPHYPLPVYPALALLAGAAALTLAQIKEFKILRHINAFIFLVVSIALPTLVVFAQARYGADPTIGFIILGIVIILAFFAAIFMWKGQGQRAIVLSVASALIMNISAYGFILPSMDQFNAGDRIAKALDANGYTTPLDPSVQLISPHFSEPSLVYHVGTHIRLGEPEKRETDITMKNGDLLLIDKEREDAVKFIETVTKALATQSICLSEITEVPGFNYAKGDPIHIEIYKAADCPSPQMGPSEPATTPDP